MSFTPAYTEPYAIRDGEVQDGGSLPTHPRVLDPDGFDSVHERISGIGEQTSWDLAAEFDSVKELAAADRERLERVPNVGAKRARAVQEYLRE